MRKSLSILILISFVLERRSVLHAQDFTEKNKMIIYSECQELLNKYQQLLIRISDFGGTNFEGAVNASENLIELFINRKVLVYNDLDPYHQLSEYYELETYASNLVMWYPDGMNVQLDLNHAKTSEIRKHDEGLYSTDILVNKKIQGNYLNKSYNSNTEELIFRIAFIEDNKNFREFKIAGVRSSKSADFLYDNKALYQLKSIEISENDKEKILNGIKQVLNDYQRSLALLGDPNEPDDEKSFYKEAFLKLFPGEKVKIFNDIEENPERSTITVSEYLDNYLGYYPEGIRNLALNIDSAEFGDIIAVDENHFFSYIYADKFFSGRFQSKNVYRLSANLVFKIILEKSDNTYTNFKIESIDRSGISFYQSDEEQEKVEIPENSILTIMRRGFHFSPFIAMGYSNILNRNIDALNLNKDYHQWEIFHSFAYSGGIRIDYFPGNRLGVGSGLEYHHYAAVYSLNGRFEDQVISYDLNDDPFYKRFDSNMDSFITISYMNIPFNLTLIINEPNQKGFYLKGGINISLFLSGDFKFRGKQDYWGYYPANPAVLDSIHYDVFGFYTRTDHDGDTKARRINLSACLSFGLNFPTGYFSALYLGPVLNFGITNISANNGKYFDIFGREHQQLPTIINYIGWEIGMRFY